MLCICLILVLSFLTYEDRYIGCVNMGAGVSVVHGDHRFTCMMGAELSWLPGRRPLWLPCRGRWWCTTRSWPSRAGKTWQCEGGGSVAAADWVLAAGWEVVEATAAVAVAVAGYR